MRHDGPTAKLLQLLELIKKYFFALVWINLAYVNFLGRKQLITNASHVFIHEVLIEFDILLKLLLERFW